MASRDRRAEINMSGIPVSGIGGLGLVAIALLMTVVLPQAKWLLVLSVGGGIVLAVVIVVVRRRRVPAAPSGDDPTILFRPEPLTRSGGGKTTRRRRSIDGTSSRVPFVVPIGAQAIPAMPVRDRS